MTVNFAQANEIRLMASPGVREILQDLVPEFERSSGHKVNTTWAGNADIVKRITGGERFDLVIMAGENIDKLVAAGKVAAGSRTDVAKSGVGVAVRAGLPKPDISSAEAVKKAVLAAKSVAYSSGPSGIYIAELFKRMGLAEEIKHKVKQTPSGVQVGNVMAQGAADLGFQQVSELIHVKGITYLGPLPAEIQLMTVFSAGLPAAASNTTASNALIKFLAAPAAAPAIRKAGMEPG
jgi:molybdate transport system substrate-binding protein